MICNSYVTIKIIIEYKKFIFELHVYMKGLEIADEI